MNNINTFINTLEYEDVAKSYRWENQSCKQTFPAFVWVDAIADFLWNGLKTSEIENKYKSTLPRVTKDTNEMYINSLLRKMQLAKKQDSQMVQNNINYDELRAWIIARIDNITSKHYRSASKTGIKIIEEWMMLKK